MTAASGTFARRLDRGGGPERGQIQLVSGNFFATIGTVMQAGAVPSLPKTTSAPRRPLIAVLSHQYWQRGYGGGPVLGRTIRVEKAPFTIVGVAPAEFFGVSASARSPMCGWPATMTVASIFPGPPAGSDAKNKQFP